MIDVNFLNYQNQIQGKVNHEVSEEPSHLLNRLSRAKIFEFNNSTDFEQFPTKIQKTLQKVANLKIGQDLLTFLIDHPQEKPLSFELSEEGFSFSREKNRIALNPHAFSIWSNRNEKFYWEMPYKVSFVHELIHFKHCLENEDKYKKMSFPDPHDTSVLLSPDLGDPEEQLTICGIDCYDKNVEIALCENHFRYAWNLPLRFTYLGIKGPKKVIQQDIPIESKQFSKFFERYWKKLPVNCYRKEALIVDIIEATPNQKKLINSIETFVKVHNLAKVDPDKVEDLKVREFWDLKL